MAVLNPQNLVLRGVRVVVGVENVRPGIGAKADTVQTPAILSQGRHRSPSLSDTAYPTRIPPQADIGLETAVTRAGRSEDSAGVPACRIPARSASHAIRLSWHLAAGHRTWQAAASTGGPVERLTPFTGDQAPAGTFLVKPPMTMKMPRLRRAGG